MRPRVALGHRVLLALLAGSLLANAGLGLRWLTRPAVKGPAVVATTGVEEPSAVAEAWRRPFPGLRSDRSPGTPVALDPCVLRQSSLRAQLEQLADVRARLLPTVHRFEAAPLNPELTSAFAAAIAERLPADRRGGIHAECRDRWCRLTGAADAELARVAAELQQAAWVGENLHLVQDAGGTLFERHTPGAIRSAELLQQALQDFESSGAVADCQAKHRGQGTLDAQVHLPEAESGAADPGFTVESRGPLAGTPLGRCIDTRFRQALAATHLPPRFGAGEALIQLPRP